MPKKKTAKKAVKKTAVKKTAKVVNVNTGFSSQSFGKDESLLASDDTLSSVLSGGKNLFREVEDLVEKKRSRRKDRTVNLTSLSGIRKRMLPLRDFTMQHTLGTYGIPYNALVSLIGPEGIGKTTFMFYLMGCCIRAGGLCYYQETEGKLISRDRALRALSSHLPNAKEIMDRIFIEEVHSLRMSEEYMYDWVETVRTKKGLPIDKPILVGVDTWSKLMSDAEAIGYYGVGPHVKSAANSKKAKGIKEGSNLGHASFAADWCRRLASWQPANNVILMLNEHQNENIDMSGSSTHLPQSYLNKRNKAKIGGRAFNQNAALQLIMTRAGEAKYPDKTKSGTRVNLRVDKNSYGPYGREMEFEHRDEHRQDSGDYYEEAFLFHESLAKLLMDHRMFGLKAKEGQYSSEQLGIFEASAEELYKAFTADPKFVKEAGSLLKIAGYYDIYEVIKDTAQRESDEGDTTDQ